ncbi:MAG TPA: serine hydrolase, partial [Opitutaceae bacterium]|nr:serine hydrolase [Opitutaceae bacterium]
MMTRRDFLIAIAFAVVGTAGRSQPGSAESRLRFRNLPASLALLEKSKGGRLGVSVLDTGSGERVGYRDDGRFAMCSTFKFLLAAAVLQRVDTGRERLDRAIVIPPKPLLFNSPLTEEHAGTEMTVSALCHASMTRS